MAYSQEDIENIFDSIIEEIEKGSPIRKVLTFYNMPSSKTFYQWLELDELKVKRYAHACEARADLIFDEVLEIADKQDVDVSEKDGIEVINHNVIARSRLQVEARKWVLSKLNPKKYGDKLDMTTDGEKINTNISILNIDPLSDDGDNHSVT